ncbi:MAG: M56 family metallopeptidase, partial [Pseudomonadota bacterium]
LYFSAMSELRSAKPLGGNLYSSARISAPAVYGVLHPRIIIPSGAIHGNIDYILMHEKVHIKRRDNLLRIIGVMTACIHWFNPLSWVFLKYFFTDMELSCDAKVLKHLDERQAREYAGAILACTSGKAFFAASFGGAKTRGRIENILSFKKLTLFSSICFSVLVLAIAAILITNAAV